MPSTALLSRCTFCGALADAVPDLDGTRHITAGDVEAGGGEAGDGGLGGVVGILAADGGVVDGAHEDGFARLQRRRVSSGDAGGVEQLGELYRVGNALALGVGGELGGLATRGGGRSGPNGGCRQCGQRRAGAGWWAGLQGEMDMVEGAGMEQKRDLGRGGAAVVVVGTAT